MFATWSVRTYNILLRHKIEVETAEQAIAAGDMVAAGKIRNAGLKCATELYRAAGLGVYMIQERLLFKKDFDTIVSWCNYLDRYVLHYDLRS